MSDEDNLLCACGHRKSDHQQLVDLPFFSACTGSVECACSRFRDDGTDGRGWGQNFGFVGSVAEAKPEAVKPSSVFDELFPAPEGLILTTRGRRGRTVYSDSKSSRSNIRAICALADEVRALRMALENRK